MNFLVCFKFLIGETILCPQLCSALYSCKYFIRIVLLKIYPFEFLCLLQQNFILLIFQSLHSLCPAHFSLVDILFTRFKWKFELYIIHFDLNQLVRYFQNYFLLNYSLWKSTQRKAMEFSLTNILVGGLTSTKYVLLE